MVFCAKYRLYKHKGLIVMIRLTILFSVLVLFFGAFNPAAAQKPADSEISNAQNTALKNKISGLMENLSQQEVAHFLVMYANYNIYSMVKAVSEDIGNAVSACAENNAEMADDINRRYDRWMDSVGGTMKEAYANLNNMSLAQTYVPQSEVKMIFGLVDKLRSVNSSRFENVPVTTPEACEFMLSKMDETEDSMNQMLRATLVSYPNLMKKTQK